jgi:hypothetical protein
MIEVMCYIGGGLVVAIFIFCVCCFLFGLLQIWVLKNETRGMTKKQLKKAEQELCKHHNTVYTDQHPDYPWTCCDCGKSV